MTAPALDREPRVSTPEAVARLRPARAEPFTDSGNEDRFVRLNRHRVRWWANRRCWLVFTGTHWTTEKGDELALRFTRSVSTELLGMAKDSDDDGERRLLTEYAKTCQSMAKRRNMLALARGQLAVVATELDADPWLFNARNGTVDLRTGELRPHRPDDLITKLAPVDFDRRATAPTWRAFLERVLDGDAELVAFVKRAAGMALCGEVRDHAFVFLHGEGRNGKSTFLNVLLEVFGEYGRQVKPDLVLKRKHDQHAAEFANLLGRRLAVMNEVSKSRSFDEGALKSITGGDRIAACFKGKDWFDFTPTHSLFFAANNRPRVDDESDGFWRRMMLVPFEVQIPEHEVDPDLQRKLLEEGSGILRWCVDGALEWRETGLSPPSRVRVAASDYRDTSDTVATFVAEACAMDGRADGRDLWTAYKAWCEAAGEEREGRNHFYERLERIEGVERTCKRPARFAGLHPTEGGGL